MAVFKCKMCGGQLEVTEGQSVCECEYCGTKQTLPKSDNEQTLNMINRANHFRRQCEFDKAAEIYEKLIAQRNDDAELYWSLLLCRYGIEYVDDPATGKKIATCHRTQFKSILDDADYKSVLQYADMTQKPVYEEEAKYIDTVQKGILEISNKEEPFDVFICYKESDDDGRRTEDSVLAQDLYYQLVREGFKVFFSRITLEGKLGTAYEPYIFAALNSAKVMVVVGTKPEYFNSIWVKNEWSRYLMLMQEDHSRTLIPAYKGMDPYDLPDALSMFQAQDMSKLGFMQDLIHGINKIMNESTEQKQTGHETQVQSEVSGDVAPLLRRIALFLEDGEWDNAKEYCNRVLDRDPECAQAYFYLLMGETKTHTFEEFEKKISENGISDNNLYKKAYRFGDDSFKQKLDDLNKQTIYNSLEKDFKNSENEEKLLSLKEKYLKLEGFKDSAEKPEEIDRKIYELADEKLRSAESSDDCYRARNSFMKIRNYKDSEQKIRECTIKEAELKEKAYNDAVDLFQNDNENDLKYAIELFESISDFKDSAEMVERCNEKIERIEKTGREIIIAIILFCVIIFIFVFIW